MPVTLQLYAASEAEVADLVGIGTRDAATADAVLGRMVETSAEDPAYDMLPVDVAGRALLWHPRLPWQGTEDAYWRALEAAVAVASWLDLQPDGCAVARDLDDLFTAADVAPGAGPLALSRRARLPLPPAEDFDVRVIAHDDARGLLQTWLVAESGTHDELTRFAAEFLSCDAAVASAGREPVDLWLFSPGHPMLAPRHPATPWPPTQPPDLGPVGPRLARYLRGS